MESFEDSHTVFAILRPANDAAKDSFGQVASKKQGDNNWNPNARRSIKIDKEPATVSTYSDASESDGGTGPERRTRSVLKGAYIFDFATAPRLPNKGWIIGGGKYSEGDDPPDILLTEKKKNDRVSSRHAVLHHNFTSGALIITASDNNNNAVTINGHEVVNDQCVLHGRTTSLEFGRLKYTLEVRRYETDGDFRYQLKSYKQRNGLGDDDYPTCLLATPSDSDFITEKYIMKNPVGDGATSVVYGAIERKTGMAVAIKKVKRTGRNSNAIDRDIMIGEYIGEHKRICHLIEYLDPAASDPKRGYETFGLDEVLLVYSPLASLTVEKIITEELSNDYDIMDDQTRLEIFWQLLEGIEFLHSIEVMHRDIKPLNMTVVSMAPGHIEARLIDFGMATKSLESHHYKVGTRPYLAPEIWAGLDKRSQSGYDDRIDMFAFGLSMYQFFCREPCDWLRIDKDGQGNINDARLQYIHRNLQVTCSDPKITQLITQCTYWDPCDRSSAREILGLRDREQSVRNQNPVESVRHDNESDKGDGGVRLGSSIGRMSISGTGLTSSSMAGSSRDGPGTPRYERSLQYQSPAIEGPSGCNVSEL